MKRRTKLSVPEKAVARRAITLGCTIASQTALIEYALKNEYIVPAEWAFQDEGYSGAVLVRAGIKEATDLAPECQIAAVPVYSADRLNRKYAYLVFLSEKLSRCGVE